jgi:hypothetical protein
MATKKQIAAQVEVKAAIKRKKNKDVEITLQKREIYKRILNSKQIK